MDIMGGGPIGFGVPVDGSGNQGLNILQQLLRIPALNVPAFRARSSAAKALTSGRQQGLSINEPLEPELEAVLIIKIGNLRERWAQIARLMYGNSSSDKAYRVYNSILNALMSDALNKKEQKEKEERKEHEMKEKELAETK